VFKLQPQDTTTDQGTFQVDEDRYSSLGKVAGAMEGRITYIRYILIK
jgi:hypothetical protein